jgi:HAD superfamily hydrolase (TIGR01549 family)
VREVLESLHRRGILLAVATNKLGRFARAIFEQFGMEGIFTVVLGDGDVSRNKPDPEMLFLAMEKMAVARDQTLFVGDSVIDIQTARNAGVRVLAIPTGNTDREDLARARPTVLLERFSDLLAHV